MSEIFGEKLVEAVVLLKEIRKKNEEENAQIDAYMKKLVEDLSEAMKPKEGEEKDSDGKPTENGGMNPEKFMEMLQKLEERTKKENEASKKASPSTPTESGTGLGEMMEELLQPPTTLSKSGTTKPSTGSPSSDPSKESGSSPKAPVEPPKDGRKKMGGAGATPPVKNKVEEVEPTDVVGEGRVWCAVCEEYHDATHVEA